MIVLDTSATIDGYFAPGLWEPFISVLTSDSVMVPQHYDAECLNALRRVDRVHTLSDDEAAGFIEFLEQMPFLRAPTLKLASSVWRLRHNMSAYDASYVALARSAGCKLLTHDRKLATAAAGLVETARLDRKPPA